MSGPVEQQQERVMTKMNLVADPYRADLKDASGIYVRAQCNGEWGSHDIAELDAQSLWTFLHSRGDAVWPANVVMILMGHEAREGKTND